MRTLVTLVAQSPTDTEPHAIAVAVNRNGTFLDIGCANGLLIQSIVAWVAEAGYNVEPFGLDLSSALVRLARQRLPDWADRICAGNAMTWQPPHTAMPGRGHPMASPSHAWFRSSERRTPRRPRGRFHDSGAALLGGATPGFGGCAVPLTLLNALGPSDSSRVRDTPF